MAKQTFKWKVPKTSIKKSIKSVKFTSLKFSPVKIKVNNSFGKSLGSSKIKIKGKIKKI